MLLEFYEDLEVGRREVLGSYAFTPENIKAYARRYDPQPFHVDEAAGKASHFGGLCASGWHTAAAYMQSYCAFHDRQSTATRPRRGRWPELAPSPGFENLQWLKPVYPGDTVRYAATIAGKRALTSKPEWGLVWYDVEGRNQHDKPVITFRAKVLVERWRGA